MRFGCGALALDLMTGALLYPSRGKVQEPIDFDLSGLISIPSEAGFSTSNGKQSATGPGRPRYCHASSMARGS